MAKDKESHSGKKHGTRIISCTCTNAFQDKQHGHGKRVGNYTSKQTARCTVCGKEH